MLNSILQETLGLHLELEASPYNAPNVCQGCSVKWRWRYLLNFVLKNNEQIFLRVLHLRKVFLKPSFLDCITVWKNLPTGFSTDSHVFL